MKTAEQIIEDKGNKLISVPPETSIKNALAVMVQNKIGSLLVKKDNDIIGIWTERDLMRNITEKSFDLEKSKISEFMVTNLYSASHTDTAFELMEFFIKKKIRHILIKKKNDYIGLISPNDVILEKYREIENLNSQLEEKLKELELAHSKVQTSEKKYRLLFEGASDLIFSLDENFNFISANKLFYESFRLKDDKINKINFFDLLYVRDIHRGFTSNIILEQINAIDDSTPTEIKIEFKTPYNQEPKEMIVRFERVSINGKNELLCRAQSKGDDVLLKYINAEFQELNIENYLTIAEDASYRLTKNLVKFLPPQEVSLLRVSLREILINAIEHGNLGISFDDKTQAMMKNKYVELIKERQSDNILGNRKVYIHYELEEDKVKYTITDEGKGFDHRSVVEETADRVNEECIPHGRGIIMTLSIFDVVAYNDKGNSVTLEKKF